MVHRGKINNDFSGCKSHGLFGCYSILYFFSLIVIFFFSYYTILVHSNYRVYFSGKPLLPMLYVACIMF